MKKINPPYSWLTISLWGICFVHCFTTSAQVKETPKQRISAFYKWYSTIHTSPFEGDCYEADGVDITKIDTKCMRKYIKSIESTGLFSSSYIKGLQQEFVQKQADIKKNGYASGVDYDRYTLSQDPPSAKNLLTALNNSSTVAISGTRAKVVVNMKNPYKLTYIYSLDLENNVWKLTKLNQNNFMQKIHATTVLGVIHNGKVALGADGQATMGNTVAKSNVRKVRKLYGGKILAGFAGSTADAFTLIERFEEKLNAFGGNMKRAAIELAKDWRTDRFLRKLEAMLIVANEAEMLIISGTGDVLEPDNQIASIGSGSMYAQSAAIALKRHARDLTAEQMVQEGLNIAADICIYTNHNIIIETL